MQGKIVVVVGATGGIGSALVQKLAEAGAKLVLAGRDNQKLVTLSSGLNSNTAILTVPTDITEPQQVETLMEKAVDKFGKIDVLVNAAGAAIMKQYHKITPEDLNAMLDLNLKGSFYTCQAAANVMKEQNFGHICNIVGILGKHPMAMATAYCAAKYGVVGFSKCLADELKRYGVKFTLFYFGGVDSPFWDQVSLKVDRQKMLRPETAADAIWFAMTCENRAIPLEINLQPDSHLFL
ncbi:SDR family oxidoreductase [Gloeocapsa sp. PCC 73106]|uniref:SDR family oxidoreductase n=1 Tax=Gloeocapsa sp. PCC 73106 TaxID=102232 RepID=UPI0002AC3AF9|nr:SDR family oxidoreductase [Gloeocapsa sp. PCC 73106]ELR99483.1 short-chain alcohol dehydrogenase [Gloeocapsa sp. PCC 73106]